MRDFLDAEFLYLISRENECSSEWVFNHLISEEKKNLFLFSRMHILWKEYEEISILIFCERKECLNLSKSYSWIIYNNLCIGKTFFERFSKYGKAHWICLPRRSAFGNGKCISDDWIRKRHRKNNLVSANITVITTNPLALHEFSIINSIFYTTTLRTKIIANNFCLFSLWIDRDISSWLTRSCRTTTCYCNCHRSNQCTNRSWKRCKNWFWLCIRRMKCHKKKLRNLIV